MSRIVKTWPSTVRRLQTGKPSEFTLLAPVELGDLYRIVAFNDPTIFVDIRITTVEPHPYSHPPERIVNVGFELVTA